MKLPFVSIIVPAYNEEKFIGSCLKSLVELDYPKERREILVVDNNCADKTVKIAGKFPVKIVKEKKQGLTYARIGGINASRGEIIAFVDADCIVNKLWLRKMVEIYLSDDKVVGVSQFLDYRPRKLMAIFGETIDNIWNPLSKTMPGGHFSFKKNAYDQCGGYSPSTQFSEDIYISKKIRKLGKIVIQKKGLVTTSSRRYNNIKNSLKYIAGVSISVFTIYILGRSFFHLKKVDEN